MALSVTSATLNGNILTIVGTSTQSIDGKELAPQSFSDAVDVSASPIGANTYVLHNSSGDTVNVPFNKTVPESADGTVISSNTASIVDAAGGVWTLHNDPTYGNVVYKNGVQIGNTDHVLSLLYVGKAFYALGDDQNYYEFNATSNSWNQVVESANGATISSNAASLIDAAGGIWTLHDDPTYANVVYKNGVQIGNTDHVLSLLYYGKSFYVLGDDQNYYEYDSSTNTWNQTTDPRGNNYPSPVQPTFYGVNGHFDWGGSGVDRQGVQPTAAVYNVIVAAMKDLGMKTFRNGFAGWGGEVAIWQDFINNYATPNGICVYPNIEGDYDPTQDGHTATETSAYNVGYAIGQTAAALKGYVPWYEIGNEEDSYALLSGSYNGIQPSHYDNRRFTVIRGYFLGVIAGIRTADLTTPIMMAGITWLHTAFNDMLFAGTQPDGTSGHTKVVVDLVALHWYTNSNSNNDNPESSEGGYNLLAHAATWGKPIRINEFGANWNVYGSNETSVKNAVIGPNLMAKWVSVAAQYNITGCDYYQIIDAAGDTSTPLTGDEMNYGVLKYDGTKKARYATIKNFISAHPK
ncbi:MULTISPECIES: hypothetical protein [unclassified Caballeronia]|uniref:hypothetical protein n=1 Tax=unclassified Caballeronia TaxID=2646786 RepID=UPI0028595EB2|nr:MULTISPECIES: hypothetical protein [unclassified Caballeronia]MDR5777645.1 hypothetical protein [Caballeronia sp. LZ002]MDR5798569.1 hypothetical protein [Caballeronia sp. LZ001]MDR5853078.1 hypothetical protein [Caballeronia sp. LZ003]